MTPKIRLNISPVIGSVMNKAFSNWASRDRHYQKIYKQLAPQARKVISDALKEIEKIEPQTYEFWWAKNHMRYYNLKGTQQRMVHQLMFEFTRYYCHESRRHHDSDSEEEKTGTGTKSTEKGGDDKAHRPEGSDQPKELPGKNGEEATA